ncbi:MAG: acyl-CoA dehydrogenase [Alteromonadaceae bacterium]|jgi:acyl-CoA dehydrogenase
MWLLIILLIALAVVLGVTDIRRKWITTPIFAFFKKILPPLSLTEKEAMESGGVWWDGELFSGKPDWDKLHAFPKPQLSATEQDFLDHQVATLIGMIDDYQITDIDRDLPADVWQYITSQGFFAMIIPKKYGGLEFSAIANSTIVTQIATRSLSVAVTVMVPNSLGPGELLLEYGTQAQKDQWLPELASGKHIPCFALTGPEAGSDAGGIPDSGIVCEQEFNGEMTLGVKITWDKRYITLAPVATVLGLAFKMFDPDNLLGGEKDIGITCALIPTDHPGVDIGDRHDPMGMAFMNGTTYGKDVFIPMDWIIGGQEYAGRGWRMLVECLSAGRGISLPALSTASGHLASRMTSAYAYIRRQFGLSIGRFEGVQEPLARIGGRAYTLEAMRTMTAGAVDLKVKPAVVSAIAKYHMTEMGREVMNDAMDIHSGKGIQMGPKNYLAYGYMAVPISVTVEGANILTRNLMIFGQGATRCHPYVLGEMAAAANPDNEQGLKDFDDLLVKHVRFAMGNAVGSLFQGLTLGRFNSAPVGGHTATYYRQLTRMSSALALCADMSMLILGGDLKRKEMISARLGDVLSQLYIASAVLKRFEDDGHQVADVPLVDYALKTALYEIGKAFDGYFQNFSNRIVANVLKTLIFPFGIEYRLPEDSIAQAVCKGMLKPGIMRDRLSHLCFLGEAEDDITGSMERAFLAMVEGDAIYRKITEAQKTGEMAKFAVFEQTINSALEKNIISEAGFNILQDAEKRRLAAINVDSFKPGEL